MGSSASRRAYIDWMRGLSVLFMIAAHTFDAWTVLEDRTTPLYKAVNFIGGLAAPMFLLLAGVSVAMAASSRRRCSTTSLTAPAVSMPAGRRLPALRSDPAMLCTSRLRAWRR